MNTSDLINQILDRLSQAEDSAKERADGSDIYDVAFLHGIEAANDIVSNIFYEWDEMNSSFKQGSQG